MGVDKLGGLGADLVLLIWWWGWGGGDEVVGTKWCGSWEAGKGRETLDRKRFPRETRTFSLSGCAATSASTSRSAGATRCTRR